MSSGTLCGVNQDPPNQLHQNWSSEFERPRRELASADGNGAAAAIRQRTGEVRFQIYHAGYAGSLAALRDAMGEEDFDCAWAEGDALSTDEAIAYARRSPGERKPPTTGLGSAE